VPSTPSTVRRDLLVSRASRGARKGCRTQGASARASRGLTAFEHPKARANALSCIQNARPTGPEAAHRPGPSRAPPTGTPAPPFEGHPPQGVASSGPGRRTSSRTTDILPIIPRVPMWPERPPPTCSTWNRPGGSALRSPESANVPPGTLDSRGSGSGDVTVRPWVATWNRMIRSPSTSSDPGTPPESLWACAAQGTEPCSPSGSPRRRRHPEPGSATSRSRRLGDGDDPRARGSSRRPCGEVRRFSARPDVRWRALSARPRTSPLSPDRMSDPRSHQHVGSGGLSERRRWSAAVSKNRIHFPSVRRAAQPMRTGVHARSTRPSSRSDRRPPSGDDRGQPRRAWRVGAPHGVPGDGAPHLFGDGCHAARGLPTTAGASRGRPEAATAAAPTRSGT
jgi:hypothetical protein